MLRFFAKRRFNYVDVTTFAIVGQLSANHANWLVIISCALAGFLVSYSAEAVCGIE